MRKEVNINDLINLLSEEYSKPEIKNMGNLEVCLSLFIGCDPPPGLSYNPCPSN